MLSIGDGSKEALGCPLKDGGRDGPSDGSKDGSALGCVIGWRVGSVDELGS